MKLERQKKAMNRFKILPFTEWAGDFEIGTATEEQKADYDLYVARKNQELDALKTALNAH